MELCSIIWRMKLNAKKYRYIKVEKNVEGPHDSTVAIRERKRICDLWHLLHPLEEKNGVEETKNVLCFELYLEKSLRFSDS